MILVDTGVLLAAVNSKDRHHRESAELLAAHAGQLVTPAERLNISTVATLNERDFRVVRPNHCEAFELVP